MNEFARGIDSPAGIETRSGSTAKPQEPGPEGSRPNKSGAPLPEQGEGPDTTTSKEQKT